MNALLSGLEQLRGFKIKISLANKKETATPAIQNLSPSGAIER